MPLETQAAAAELLNVSERLLEGSELGAVELLVADRGELEAGARQRNDVDMERWVAEIKLRADVRIGEISKALETGHKIGRKSKVQLPANGKLKAEVLKEAGISTSAAHRAEQLAENPAAVGAASQFPSARSV